MWSCACLFHVVREDLVTVLGRLAEATRSGGRIHASFKEGDGEVRTSSGTPDAPQRYTDTLWRDDLRSQFAAAGWVVDEIGSHGDKPWLAVRGIDPEDRAPQQRCSSCLVGPGDRPPCSPQTDHIGGGVSSNNAQHWSSCVFATAGW